MQKSRIRHTPFPYESGHGHGIKASDCAHDRWWIHQLVPRPQIHWSLGFISIIQNCEKPMEYFWIKLMDQLLAMVALDKTIILGLLRLGMIFILAYAEHGNSVKITVFSHQLWHMRKATSWK